MTYMILQALAAQAAAADVDVARTSPVPGKDDAPKGAGKKGSKDEKKGKEKKDKDKSKSKEKEEKKKVGLK
jgi:hypothetical protein